MILLTVGTSKPFDRLVLAMDELVASGAVKEKVFAQIGVEGTRPRHMEFTELLEKPEFDELLGRASFVVSHAGMGTITMCLEQGKRLIVMPRLRRYGELVNDHQISTARRFESLGHVLAAYEPGDIARRLEEVASFVPRPRVADPESVARRIGEFLGRI